jgi:hypothetical protein
VVSVVLQPMRGSPDVSVCVAFMIVLPLPCIPPGGDRLPNCVAGAEAGAGRHAWFWAYGHGGVTAGHGGGWWPGVGFRGAGDRCRRTA